jgi:hypothetical protein
MKSKKKEFYRRPQGAVLAARLHEPRRLIQVVAGPRQVGKSMLVQQVAERLDFPVRYASADEPMLRGVGWIVQQWEAARLSAGPAVAVLVLDEIQKIPGWSETIKRLRDEDAARLGWSREGNCDWGPWCRRRRSVGGGR